MCFSSSYCRETLSGQIDVLFWNWISVLKIHCGFQTLVLIVSDMTLSTTPHFFNKTKTDCCRKGRHVIRAIIYYTKYIVQLSLRKYLDLGFTCYQKHMRSKQFLIVKTQTFFSRKKSQMTTHYIKRSKLSRCC